MSGEKSDIFSFPTSATQALSQRPTGASATAAPVRAMPQYKYAAGVRNPQQHMASQPQVAMQQVRMQQTHNFSIRQFKTVVCRGKCLLTVC